MEHLDPIKLRLIAQKLGPDEEKWNRISGSLITHEHFGTGRLLGVSKVSPEKRLFKLAIDFSDSGVRTVSLLGMETIPSFLSIQLRHEHAALPYLADVVSLLERRRQSERATEERARLRQEHDERAKMDRLLQDQRAQAEFALRIAQWEEASGRSWADSTALFKRLARDWDVPIGDFFPDDPAFDILSRLENGQELSDLDLELLAERGAPELADKLDRIRVKEVEYAETGVLGILAAISRLWRGLNRPEMALKATGKVIGSDHRPLISMTHDAEATLLTTRGGALRDMGDLLSARICAQRSIDIRPNHGFAYCLLAAIEIDEGDIARGEAKFSECERLPPHSNVDAWRRSLLQSSKNPAEYAAYLLAKDPERFGWAKRYLQARAQRFTY